MGCQALSYFMNLLHDLLRGVFLAQSNSDLFVPLRDTSTDTIKLIFTLRLNEYDLIALLDNVQVIVLLL